MSDKLMEWKCFACTGGGNPCTLKAYESDGRPTKCVYGLTSNINCRWDESEEPKHETVEQWEIRTGDKYNHNSPVYVYHETGGWDYMRFRKAINLGFMDNYVYVATANGNPPNEAEKGE